MRPNQVNSLPGAASAVCQQRFAHVRTPVLDGKRESDCLCLCLLSFLRMKTFVVACLGSCLGTVWVTVRRCRLACCQAAQRMLYHQACAPAQAHIPGLSCVHLPFGLCACLPLAFACGLCCHCLACASQLGLDGCVCACETRMCCRKLTPCHAPKHTVWPCRSFIALAMRGRRARSFCGKGAASR